MKTKRKCPNCQTRTSKHIADGSTEHNAEHKWYSYYECEECKRVQTFPIKRPPQAKTEYSVCSTIHTPIGIDYNV